ncbi:MAG: class I SAM-dependent methyltransferase [Ginsengibacter sp.]|jgi:SAM-dependent methyltransferase
MDKIPQKMREASVERLNTYSLKWKRIDYIVMHFLIRDLKYAISKFASGKILDVGCGNKPYESLFHTSRENYIGCDVVQSSDDKVDILCLATDINAPSDSFDTVFSTQVMEHVDNSDLMMSECNRVLRSDGYLVLSVPFSWELHEEPYDFFRFTKYGLMELCKRNNFEVIEIIPNGGKWAAIAQLNMNIFFSALKKKNIILRGIRFLLINLHITSLLNWIAIKIDNMAFDPLFTLNYVLIAKKIKSTTTIES